MRTLRYRFWTGCCDVIVALGGYGTGLYLWSLGKASDCIDWGGGA